MEVLGFPPMACGSADKEVTPKKGLQKEAKRVVTPHLMLSKATELLNHGLRERAKAETEMLMAGIDAHNRMLENKPITIERAGLILRRLLDKGLFCKLRARQIFNELTDF
ncbi:hypothetical protein L1987_88210 [Smallanthus sonchifolius]|nr:hypothetical protein L1987_89883 [Smallanthus sonchifolius]KAI3668777.1 hypothetical protein L1987_88210 [Smallanthus sonchifolius]